ncbi:uncharacterized protein LOC133248799 [Bos javanicus]|uniref:uncharacterized protein LOC133248799 n=1 Tax=Bos javanicus TaxID=9906 RepID=UPI002AA79920|nr:uncharacterized protein LOC133248799 [Bos javanicus]
MATPGRGGARRLGCEEPRESGVSFRYPGLCSCPLGRQRPRTRNPRLGTDPSGPTGCRPQPKVTTGLSSSGVSSRLPAPWLSPGRPLLPTAIQRGLRIGGAKRSRCWSFWHCRCPRRLCGVVQLAGRKTQAECHQDRTGAARKLACRVSQFPDQRLNGCPGRWKSRVQRLDPGAPGSSAPTPSGRSHCPAHPGGRPRLRHGAAGAGGGRTADPRLPYSLDQRAVLPECLLQDHGQGARDMAARGVYSFARR